MNRSALVVWGGWDGHEPELVARRFHGILENEGFSVRTVQGMEQLPGSEALAALDLLVPVTTGCQMDSETSQKITHAVGEGLGLAGCHGGMCDAFRNDTEWQFMTGGQWVSHPGNADVEYSVHVRRNSSPITQGIEDFRVKSEQYYMHIDPAIEVLATTRFPSVEYYNSPNKPVDMPVVWTKYWGSGRVFYNSLGHHDDVFDLAPAAQELMRRGFLWAARQAK